MKNQSRYGIFFWFKSHNLRFFNFYFLVPQNAQVLPNNFNEKETDTKTVLPRNPSHSPLQEENPQNISFRFEPPSETAVGEKRESKGTKKMFYECPLCDCTFNQSKQTADKIEHHEKAHEGNGRNKCSKCSFSHDRLNILTFHLKYHHRGRVESNKEESVQVWILFLILLPFLIL